MPYSLTDMALYFFMYSFCGWLMETVLCSFQEKHFVNRGFLNGPFCPIYGCGIVLILIFLLPVRDGIGKLWVAVPVIFAVGAFLASVVEYFTSWLMEKLFHARWWDYSGYRFNLNGRICLWISLAWGGLATVFVYLIQPWFEAFVELLYGWNARLPVILAAGMCALLAVDCTVSFRIARAIGNKLEQLDKLGALIREHLDRLPSAQDVVLKLESTFDRLEEKRRENRTETVVEETLSDKAAAALRAKVAELREMRDRLMLETKGLQKRMLRAFPSMRQSADAETANAWRDVLHIRSKREEAAEKKEHTDRD